MGFLTRNIELEEYFKLQAYSWKMLSDKDYTTLFHRWREMYETCILDKEYTTGARALYAMQDKLPIQNAYIFNAPNYKPLGQTHGRYIKEQSYGYELDILSSLDRVVFNNCNVIITSNSLSFTCIFNKEAPELISEKYCEGSISN